MQKEIKNLKQVLIAIIFMFLSVPGLLAQPIPPNPQSPLVGGGIILLILGLTYGIIKYNKNKKR